MCGGRLMAQEKGECKDRCVQIASSHWGIVLQAHLVSHMHTQICKVYQLMHWHDPYACTEGYVLYVHARKRQFVHDHGPCTCTEDCLMYSHSRKHHFVHDKTTHDLQEKHWTRATDVRLQLRDGYIVSKLYTISSTCENAFHKNLCCSSTDL